MVSTTRFVVIFHEITWDGATATISVVTDIACHLTCLHTKSPMRVHNSEKNVRGSLVLGNPDYCFTSYNETEQNEAGDTLTHTFSFGDFGVGEQRWWVFVGTVGGVDSPSQSPIFTYKYKDTPVYSLGIYGQEDVLVGSVSLESGENVGLVYRDPPETVITISC